MLRRLRRQAFILIYMLALVVWALLAYDTLGVWNDYQGRAQVALARSALGPTATPTLPPTRTPSPTVTPTASPMPTVAVLPTPTAVPAAKLHPKTGRYIAAWLPTSFDDADLVRRSFEENKDILDEVSPFWYSVDTQTGALRFDDDARDQTLVAAAHAADVLVMPSIHNVNFDDPGLVVGMFDDPVRRTAHVAALLEEVMTYNYDGIDVDYETLPPRARPGYSAFMQELSVALHAKGKLLTVAVHAKTTDDGGLGAFQDWVLLGQICDRVRIMTYDYSWRGGAAGPIAPLAWVSSVTEYARSVIPPGKIQVGVPFYAYNWGQNDELAVSQTWLQVQALIDRTTATVDFRERDSSGPIQEKWFQYRSGTQLRTVWFADSSALASKLNMVERQDVGGIAIWRLGSEDPENWAVIRRQISTNPAVVQQIMNTYLPDH